MRVCFLSASLVTPLPSPHNELHEAADRRRFIDWRTGLRRLIWIPILAASCVLTPVQAATFSVASTSDSGSGSLRAALTAAGATGGTITFDSTVFAASNTASQNTITLLSSLAIPANTTIQGLTSGGGATLKNLVTIDGGGSASNFPMFTVNGEVAGAALANLIITDGHVASQGGAVQNAGSLTVSNCTFLNNYAGGYVSELGNGGGAIFSSGTLTITGSTFLNNASAPGGAVALVSGTASVSNSTFSNNTALSTYAGGAFFINSGATLTVSNSTFSGNSADGGGAIIDYGTLTMTNSIVVNNSGDGLYSGGTMTVSNSLIAANAGGDCVVGSSTCPTNGTNGNLIGVGGVALAPLGNYGGPTQTIIPVPGSPAICLGAATPLATDQRGAARATSYGSTSCVDAGAVQTHYTLSFAAPGTQPPASVAINTTMTAPVAALLENGVPFAYASVASATPALSLGSVAINDADSALSAGATKSQALDSASGLAAFGNLSFSSAHAGDTLTATLPVAPSLSVSATSNSFDVLKIGQTIAFTSTPPTNPVVTGSYTINATASSGLTVAFSVDANSTAGACTLSGSVVSFTGAGSCIIDANQAGDANYLAAAQMQQLIAIGKTTSTVTLQSSLDPATFGQSVMFTATVAGLAPTGTVTFMLGSSTLCANVALVGNAATCTTTALPTAHNAISAVYSGDLNNAPSLPTTYIQTVNPKSTTVSLVAAPDPVVIGQPVTLTATVAGDPPTGSVSFTDNGAALPCSPVALVPGTTSSTAACTVTLTGAGSHSLVAIYSGDSNFVGATSSALVVSVNVPPVAAPALDRWVMILLCGLLGAAVFVQLRRV
jgi:hypothetical protein